MIGILQSLCALTLGMAGGYGVAECFRIMGW